MVVSVGKRAANGLQVLLHRYFIKLGGVPLDDFNGILRAFAQARSQTVTEVVSIQHRLAMDDFYSPFSTGRYAKAAAVTLVLVNLNYFTNHWLLHFG
jgi:hypothetical protein